MKTYESRVKIATWVPSTEVKTHTMRVIAGEDEGDCYVAVMAGDSGTYLKSSLHVIGHLIAMLREAGVEWDRILAKLRGVANQPFLPSQDKTCGIIDGLALGLERSLERRKADGL